MHTPINRGFSSVTIWFALLFAQNVFAAIDARIEASKTSGVAPLAVFFDATTTTSTATNKPFHDLNYSWDFGDPTAGNWQHGNVNRRQKNKASGPVAAHVFKTPGTYTVRLWTKGLNGDTDTETVTITVQNPNSVFSGTNTVCFSTSGNYSGCPSGARRIRTSSFQTVANYIGSGRRILLRKGETWNSTDRTDILANGPGMISSFGSGSSRPRIHNTGQFSTFRVGYRVRDWRIVGLEFTGQGGDDFSILDVYGEAQDVLFMGNKSADSFGRAVMANNALFRLENWELPQKLFIVDNDLRLFSAHIMFIAAGKLAIQGNYLDDTETNGGEHVVRITHVEEAVVQHNYFAHPLINKGVLTIRNAQRELSCRYCGRDTRDIVVSDNHFYGGADSTVALIGAQGSGYTGHGTDVIVERNYFSRSANKPGEVQMALNVANVDGITIRNNVVLMQNWETYRGIDLSTVGGVRNVYLYNNSCYTPDNPSMRVRCINNRGATNVWASNNLLYAPNHTRGRTLVIEGTTTGGSNMTAWRNPFIRNNINGPEDFALATQSIAIGAGRLAPVYVDYTKKTTYPRSLDVGAYRYGAAASTLDVLPHILLLLSGD